MADEIIVVLVAEEGKKYEANGEAIASYYPEGKRGALLVFMPLGAEPGEKYRVKLQPIRPDRTGAMMYRAAPAPPLYTERWVDFGDGTIGCVTFCTDWTLKESRCEERDRRPKVRRDNLVRVKWTPTLVLGVDRASSFIEDVPVQLIAEEEEAPDEKGALVWKILDQRDDRHSAVSRPIVELFVDPSCEWWSHRMDPTYFAAWKISVHAQYAREPSATLGSVAIPGQTWMDLPVWCRQELERLWPLCACGCSRVDASAGATVCTTCVRGAAQTAVVDHALPPAKRKEIEKQARELLDGSRFPQAEGEQLLELLDQDPDVGKYLTTKNYRGYPWYYKTPHGVFGSKFPPEVLELYARLTEARGAGLVRLTCWLSGGHKPSAHDCYYRTQVNHDTVPLDPHSITGVNIDNCLVDFEALRAEREEKARKKAQEDADRVTLAPVFKVLGEEDLKWARTIRGFAERVRMHAGSRGVGILRREINPGYGHDRKQGAIERAIPNIGSTDEGHHFLSLYRDRDVSMWIEGAVAWLERGISFPAPELTPTGSGGFEYHKGRDFRCPKGETARLTGNEFRRYKAGEPVQISCEICGAQGVVQTNAPSPQPPTEPAASGKEILLADKLQLLREWSEKQKRKK
jgi:hypothetical protein